jgi:hypothetical protein
VVGTTGCRWAGWRQRHQRWVRLWAITLWVGLAALLVVLVLVPEFRIWLRIWLWLYALLVAWFVVARTRTVSWRLVAPLIDARHLRRGAIAVSEPGEMPSGSAPEVTASPGLIADQWTARLSTWRASAATPPLRRATT